MNSKYDAALDRAADALRQELRRQEGVSNSVGEANQYIDVAYADDREFIGVTVAEFLREVGFPNFAADVLRHVNEGSEGNG